MAGRARFGDGVLMLPNALVFTPITRVVVLAIGLAIAAAPFSGTALAGITRPYVAKSELTLSPGIDFAVGTMRTTGGRIQSVRVATVDPSLPEVRVRSLLSNDRVLWREVVTRTASRKSRPGNRVMVATNGSMAKRDAVDAYAAPQGTHISNGELMVAQACATPTLGIGDDGEARIDNVRVQVTLLPPGKTVPRRVPRVNTHRDDTAVVLFTPRFGPSTRTKSGGIEVVLELSDRLRPSASQQVRVLKVRRGAGNTKLRPDRGILSMRGPDNDWVRELRVGQRLRLDTTVVRRVDKACGGTIAPAVGWEDTVESMSGNHFITRNAQVAAPSKAVYPSGVQRHPRTAAGVTADGEVLMVTVDGRRAGYSVGVTLAEMGQLMRSLGAVHAFNLDGGGSTVMARRKLAVDQFVVANRPSDGRERPATSTLAAFEHTP